MKVPVLDSKIQKKLRI